LIPIGFLLLTAAWIDLNSLRQFRRGASWRDLCSLKLAAGLLVPLVCIFAYDFAAFGQPFGYSNVFSVANMPQHLVFYALDLMLMYPLMLLAPLVYRGPLRFEVIVVCFGTLIVVSSYYYIDTAHGLAENLLTGLRLLLPVMPLWLLAYAGVIQSVTRQAGHLQPGTAITVTVAGAMGAGIVSHTHQMHLNDALKVRNAIYAATSADDVLLMNDEAAKFVSPAWGQRPYRLGWPEGEAASLRHRDINIVFAEQGSDLEGFQMYVAASDELDAQRVSDQHIGGWHLVVWRHRV
jgi:hypothetical protein